VSLLHMHIWLTKLSSDFQLQTFRAEGYLQG